MHAIEKWHKLTGIKDSVTYQENLDDLLADDVVFYSPVVHTPQKGKILTKLYLSAAGGVFNTNEGDVKQEKKPTDGFRYVKEIIGENNACLEFETTLNGIHVNGIDLITWNKENKITEFRVLVRPLQAVNMLHQMMGKMLETLK
mgnify:CR=1 FL=1